VRVCSEGAVPLLQAALVGSSAVVEQPPRAPLPVPLAVVRQLPRAVLVVAFLEGVARPLLVLGSLAVAPQQPQAVLVAASLEGVAQPRPQPQLAEASSEVAATQQLPAVLVVFSEGAAQPLPRPAAASLEVALRPPLVEVAPSEVPPPLVEASLEGHLRLLRTLAVVSSGVVVQPLPLRAAACSEEAL